MLIILMFVDVASIRWPHLIVSHLSNTHQSVILKVGEMAAQWIPLHRFPHLETLVYSLGDPIAPVVSCAKEIWSKPALSDAGQSSSDAWPLSLVYRHVWDATNASSCCVNPHLIHFSGSLLIGRSGCLPLFLGSGREAGAEPHAVKALLFTAIPEIINGLFLPYWILHPKSIMHKFKKINKK